MAEQWHIKEKVFMCVCDLGEMVENGHTVKSEIIERILVMFSDLYFILKIQETIGGFSVRQWHEHYCFYLFIARKQCADWSGEEQDSMWEGNIVILLEDDSDLGHGRKWWGIGKSRGI